MTSNPQPKAIKRFVETASSRQIADAIETASKVPLVVSLKGKPGTGKTWAVRHYGRYHFSYHATLTNTYKTPRGFLRLLCETFGLRFMAKNPSSDQMHRDLFEHVFDVVKLRTDSVLEERPEQPILFIDEAQLLDRNALFDLMKLHEHSGLSVIFISNHQRLAQTRAHDVYEDDGNLSRIDWQIEADFPDETDLRNICIEHNVAFPAIGPLVSYGTGQSLRQFVRLLDTARVQAGESGPIMDAHLRVAVSLISPPKEAARFLKITRNAA